MKRLLLICALCLLGSALHAVPPSDVEAAMVHGRLYRKAEHNLQFGNAEHRLKAAMFLGARRNPRYLRLIARELLRDLKHTDTYFQMPRNAPVVKSYMAWALGRIGHPKAIPYLLKALTIVSATIEDEQKRIAAAQKAADDRYRKEKETKGSRPIINDSPLRTIILQKRRPGPYLQGKAHALPYSPDVYWSLSDEFKGMMAPDLTVSQVRVRLMGFNWVNTAFYIFDAVGEIYADTLHKDRINSKHAEAIGAYLNQKYFTFIRGAAAVCLGKMGSPRAIQLLEAAYDSEKSDEVKAKIAHGILRNDRARFKYYLQILEYLEDGRDHVRYPAAVALRDLKMGESLIALQEAYKIEHVPGIRDVLKEAIDHARIDNLRIPD